MRERQTHKQRLISNGTRNVGREAREGTSQDRARARREGWFAWARARRKFKGRSSFSLRRAWLWPSILDAFERTGRCCPSLCSSHGIPTRLEMPDNRWPQDWEEIYWKPMSQWYLLAWPPRYWVGTTNISTPVLPKRMAADLARDVATHTSMTLAWGLGCMGRRCWLSSRSRNRLFHGGRVVAANHVCRHLP